MKFLIIKLKIINILKKKRFYHYLFNIEPKNKKNNNCNQ